VPWEKPQREFANQLLDLADSQYDEVRWIALALDPDLVKLPWQHLVQRKLRRTGLIITLVPSLSWLHVAARNYREREAGEPRLLLADDDILVDPDASDEQRYALLSVKELVSSTKGALHRALASVAVVYGHGDLTESRLPVIAAPRDVIRLDQWEELGAFDTVVVHSCFGGHSDRAALGDFGGLPRVLLPSGARAVCAPVCKVLPETAGLFHSELVRQGDSCLGERYLSAVDGDYRVALYNLYGFPYLPRSNGRD
jgi:hypothetical protein